MKNDEWRFRIYHTRLGFWRWHASGRGVFNVSEPSPHLPRRSREACEAAADEWVKRKRDKENGIHEFRVP